MVERPAKYRRVSALHPRVGIGQVFLRARALGQVARPEQVCAENGHGGQRDHERRYQREADGEREREEERANQPLDESERGEYDYGGQRRSGDRGPDLDRRVERGAPPLPAALDVAVHVLQDDDAVVHDPSDRYCETAEGHEVERESLPTHQNDAGQDAQRYRKSDHQRRAQGVQHSLDGGGPERHEEQEDDGHGEGQPQNGLSLQGGYLSLYRRPIVGDDHYFDIRRQAAHVLKGLGNGVGNVDRVGVRLLDDRDAQAAFAVRAGYAGNFTGAERYVGHVSKRHRNGRPGRRLP